MKYKIAAGIAAGIPFADLLPRYLARDDVRQAFGITEDFLQGLRQRQISIINGQLQTSVFEDYVTTLTVPVGIFGTTQNSVGGVVLGVTVVGGALADDIVRAATPTLSALSSGARVAIGVATIGVGVMISAGVCACEHSTGRIYDPGAIAAPII
ncbi:unnamed protein product [Rotaria sordida]|uniref:Uncharacterized protein n=1 Tax=Rotaria sordida TaxID=392033 RepID=A0A814VVK2_9BILA|nr:unnamed protein product [Rotaria sordida]